MGLSSSKRSLDGLDALTWCRISAGLSEFYSQSANGNCNIKKRVLIRRLPRNNSANGEFAKVARTITLCTYLPNNPYDIFSPLSFSYVQPFVLYILHCSWQDWECFFFQRRLTRGNWICPATPFRRFPHFSCTDWNSLQSTLEKNRPRKPNLFLINAPVCTSNLLPLF